MFALLLADTVGGKKKERQSTSSSYDLSACEYLHALSVLAWLLGVFRWLAAGEREAGEECHHGDEEEDELHFWINCVLDGRFWALATSTY